MKEEGEKEESLRIQEIILESKVFFFSIVFFLF